MEIWSKTIGPVEYFRGIGSACLLLQWAWRIPTYWPVGIAITGTGIWVMNRWLKRNEKMLKNFGSMSENQKMRFLIYGIVLVFGHAAVFRFL